MNYMYIYYTLTFPIVPVCSFPLGWLVEFICGGNLHLVT